MRLLASTPFLGVRQAYLKLLPADAAGDQRVLIMPLPDSPKRR